MASAPGSAATTIAAAWSGVALDAVAPGASAAAASAGMASDVIGPGVDALGRSTVETAIGVVAGTFSGVTTGATAITLVSLSGTSAGGAWTVSLEDWVIEAPLELGEGLAAIAAVVKPSVDAPVEVSSNQDCRTSGISRL